MNQLVQKLSKPAYGNPCNGCGLCCLTEQCDISLAVFGDQKVCPALEPLGDRLVCGLMHRPLTYMADIPAEREPIWGEFFRLMLGSGMGCDGWDPELDGIDQDEAAMIDFWKTVTMRQEIERRRERLKQLRPWDPTSCGDPPTAA